MHLFKSSDVTPDGGVLRAAFPRKPCTSKYSFSYSERCVFSHDSCLFPSISIASSPYSHCHCGLANSAAHCVLLACVWTSLGQLRLEAGDFPTAGLCPPHLSHLSFNSVSHLLPHTRVHLVYFHLFSSSLSSFFPSKAMCISFWVWQPCL